MLDKLLTNNFKKTEAKEFFKVIMDKYPFLEAYFNSNNNLKNHFNKNVNVFYDKDENKNCIKFIFNIKNTDEQGTFTISFSKENGNITVKALDFIQKNNQKKYQLANSYNIHVSSDRSYSMSHKIYAYYNTENQTLIDEKSLYFDSDNRLINYVDSKHNIPEYKNSKYKKLRKI